MAGTGIFHRVSGNQAFVYGSLHAVVYQHARKGAGGRGGDGWEGWGKKGWEGAARKTGVEDAVTTRPPGDGGRRGGGRSESDRETERLFNGVEPSRRCVAFV